MVASALAFLLGPAGRWVALVLALSIWTTYHRLDAAGDAERACNAEHQAAEIAALQMQLEVARKIEQTATQRADQAVSEMKSLQEKSDALEKLVSENPIADCDIPPDIRERLRAIR